jgi:hypothetical protein
MLSSCCGTAKRPQRRTLHAFARLLGVPLIILYLIPIEQHRKYEAATAITQATRICRPLSVGKRRVILDLVQGTGLRSNSCH